jgi:hypothetical protein
MVAWWIEPTWRYAYKEQTMSDMTHADLPTASSAAVSDNRITQEQHNQLMAFVANPQAFNFGSLFGTIFPILSLIFPQAAPIFALIGSLFGGIIPGPTPIPPTPTPTPGSLWDQILLFIKSILAGGVLPVPTPIPGGGGTIPVTPVIW